MAFQSDEIFDAHLHIIDPRFPVISNTGFEPAPFTVDDHRVATQTSNVTGGAVVSASFQGFDQTYLVDALRRLGDGFVGVTQLPGDVPDETIEELDRAGVRALRFNVYRGGPAVLDDLEKLARRAHSVAGWHAELYVDASDLPQLAPVLDRLPQVVIDHLGMSDDHSGTLLNLVARGAVVKASGFGRIDLEDPDGLMARILELNPGGLIFGTDLPSTRARIPFRPDDVRRVRRAIGPAHARVVFHDNALRLYREGRAR